ncbi:winged helix-turn-helix domain-containing protein [Methanoregula sp.]|jgi:DNA-binding MarR family transcriptional regulator|uniref:winged helix-turn-helix domain-containing protein n=1 Tax=Methanoregula sp. TaxID=2052170 RepID=UPI00262B11EE|nr:winged helix-turn-helix domain-containing protein [Methanoregula sp.]MDD5142979.1 winged helix-turn-helix domain-containing protein [Methanoregula sp.]
MKKPFEGLFGDTCETRLLQFLLPMYGIEFDMKELKDEVKLTRQSISKAMKKFSDRGMVKIRKDGRTWLYSINEESSLIQRLEDFDNSLIESVIGEEEFKEILKAHEKRMRVEATERQKNGADKIILHRNEEREPTSLEWPGSYGSQYQWEDAKAKTENEIAKPYELNVYPRIPIGSGA